MKLGPALAGLLLLCLGAAIDVPKAHEVQHSITQGPATIIRLHYPDGSPFAYEAFEIYRTGERVPYAVGRTDAQGQAVFAPDAAGSWRVKAFSDDGHGVEVAFTVDTSLQVRDEQRSFYERHARLLVGIGAILGIFGLISLFAQGGRLR